MAENPPSTDKTSQNNNGSPSPNAPTTNAVFQSGKKARDENIGLSLMALLLVATASTLFHTMSEPVGTWGVVIIGAFVLVLVVLIVSRVFPRFFWGVLVVGALLVYVASLAYQASAPGRALRQQTWTTRSVMVGSSQHNLIVSYPKEVPFQASDQPGVPLFVYFDGADAALSVDTTTAISFTLAFLPESQGVVFTDDKGIPVLPQIAVRTGEESSQPAALYVRSALTNTQPVTITVALAARPDSPGVAWQDLSTIAILTESAFHAWWRRFLGMLLGPATPVLALVGTLLGFGWQWWQDLKRREEEERRSRAAMIERVLTTAQSSPSQAARDYVQIHRESQRQNWGTDFQESLRETRIRLDDYPWHDELFQEAIRALGKDTFESNSVDGVLKDLSDLVPDAPEVEDLRSFTGIVKHFWKKSREQDESKPTGTDNEEPVEIGHSVSIILRVLQRYGDPIRPVSVKVLAWFVGQPETISEVKKQLEASPFGREILQEHDFEAPLLELAEEEGTAIAPEIKQAAKDLLTLRRRQTGRWLRLWPESRQADLVEISRWLSRGGLAFNPFGPEAGELDPFLEKYVIPTPFEDARGPLPTIIFGASGSGKTTAALTIAHDCNDPPDSPREAAAFPVYYPLQIYQDANVSSVTHVEALATAIARALVGYLGTNPNGFLQLPMSRQKQMSRLLLATFGSVEHLYSALRTAGSLYSANRIRAEIGRLEVERLSTGAASVADWLLLLDQPMPSQFERVYAFVDVSSRLTPSATEHVIEQLTTLVDLLIPLAARQVILKFFVPSRLERYLGNVHGCRRVFLRWDEDLLRQLLEARMKQARGSDYGFNALFGPGGLADPSGQLARACAASKGPPRRLVALGNELIYRHVMRPGASRELDIKEFETMLRMEHPQR